MYYYHYGSTIPNIPFLEKIERTDFDSLFDSHLAKMIKFLLEYQKDTIRNEFYFTSANYIGLEQFIIENIDAFEKKQVIQESNWEFVEEAKDILRAKLKEVLKESYQLLSPFLKFTMNCFENYWLYQTAHPNTTNNPWEGTWKMIQKGYIFCITTDEKLIQEYAPHFRGIQNNNIVLLVASPNSQNHKAIYKTIDDCFHFQFHIYKFLEENKISKQNAIILEDILAKLGLTSDNKVIKKALKYLRKNHLIEIDAENRLFIPREEDILQTPNYQKLLEKLHFHQQKAKEISMKLENKYPLVTKSTSNI